jgi:hypothetical protein
VQAESKLLEMSKSDEFAQAKETALQGTKTLVTSIRNFDPAEAQQSLVQFKATTETTLEQVKSTTEAFFASFKAMVGLDASPPSGEQPPPPSDSDGEGSATVEAVATPSVDGSAAQTEPATATGAVHTEKVGEDFGQSKKEDLDTYSSRRG